MKNEKLIGRKEREKEKFKVLGDLNKRNIHSLPPPPSSKGGGGPSLGGIRGNTGNPELDAAIAVGRTAQNLGISADDVARGGKAAYDMGARPEHLVQAAKYANAV